MKLRRLIDAVKMRPVLYDPGHEDYSRHKEKDIKWEEVAEESNLPSGADAKTSWMKLRQSLRDALRRQQKCMRNGVETFKLWKYQKQMEFLLPFMSSQLLEGCSFDNMDDSETSSHNNYFNDDQEDSQMMMLNYADTKPEEVVQMSPLAEPPTNTASSASKRTLSKDPPGGSSKRNRMMARSSLLHPNDDGLYYFFLSMYETTRNMPQASQLVVKNNIFRVVTSVEASLMNIATGLPEQGGSAGARQWPCNDASSDNDGHADNE